MEDGSIPEWISRSALLVPARIHAYLLNRALILENRESGGCEGDRSRVLKEPSLLDLRLLIWGVSSGVNGPGHARIIISPRCFRFAGTFPWILRLPRLVVFLDDRDMLLLWEVS